jgi:hypothetical protein
MLAARSGSRIRFSRPCRYITGVRGPGGFPPPECHIIDGKPLWAWCAVSYWLMQNNLLRPEESWNAEVVAAINNALESARQRDRHPDLVAEADGCAIRGSSPGVAGVRRCHLNVHGGAAPGMEMSRAFFCSAASGSPGVRGRPPQRTCMVAVMYLRL